MVACAPCELLRNEQKNVFPFSGNPPQARVSGSNSRFSDWCSKFNE